LVYCKRLQRLQGEVANLQNKFANVPFPSGTQVCDEAAIDAVVKDNFHKDGKKFKSGTGMLGTDNDYWKTNISKEQKGQAAIEIYEKFKGNGYTPQAALAVLAQVAGETLFDMSVPGGGSNANYPKTDNNYWPDKSIFQLNMKAIPERSKRMEKWHTYDQSTGENYYDMIGGGKQAAHAPTKYATGGFKKDRHGNDRLLAKNHSTAKKGSGRGALTEEEWLKGDYWDAGDVGAAAMYSIARLRMQSGKTVGQGRLGALDAIMKNPDATGAQIYALMRNTTFAKGVATKNQVSTKKRMDFGEKYFGKCFTGDGYQQNFKPGTLHYYKKGKLTAPWKKQGLM